MTSQKASEPGFTHQSGVPLESSLGRLVVLEANFGPVSSDQPLCPHVTHRSPLFSPQISTFVPLTHNLVTTSCMQRVTCDMLPPQPPRPTIHNDAVEQCGLIKAMQIPPKLGPVGGSRSHLELRPPSQVLRCFPADVELHRFTVPFIPFSENTLWVSPGSKMWAGALGAVRKRHFETHPMRVLTSS